MQGDDSRPSRRIGIVGAGAIGASIGLALRAAGDEVLLADADEAARDEAVARGAGSPWPPGTRVDHAVISVPPAVTAEVTRGVLIRDVADSVSHTTSVMTHPLHEMQNLGLP